MKISYYGKLDPRRLTSSIKTIDDLIALIETRGDTLVIDGQTRIDLPRMISPQRSLEIHGSVTGSFLLKGDIDFSLVKGTLSSLNAQSAAIYLNATFTGNLLFDEATIQANQTQENTSVALAPPTVAITTMSSNNAVTNAAITKLTMRKSCLKGCAIYANELELIDDNEISYSVQTDAILSFNQLTATRAGALRVANLEFMTVGDCATLPKLVVEGCLSLDGFWDIQSLVINDRNHNLTVISLPDDREPEFDGDYRVAGLIIHDITVTRQNKIATTLLCKNAHLVFKDCRKVLNKVRIVIEDTTVTYENSADVVELVVQDKCQLVLDNLSISAHEDEYQHVDHVDTTDTDRHFSPSAHANGVSFDTESKDTSADQKDEEKPSPKNDQRTSTSTSNAKSGSGETKLKNLIGLGDVKQHLAKMIYVASMNVIRRERNLTVAEGFSNHMVFAGPPGTGKTTVANIVAQILFEKGVIRENKMIVASNSSPNGGGSDAKKSMPLIGTHVGESDLFTNQAIEAASGGILFIDEAYSLDDPKNPYAKDAVNALMVAMENGRDDNLFIFAGYTKEMHHFLDEANPGLRSRIPTWIEFPDYTVSELEQIAQFILKAQGATLSDELFRSQTFSRLLNFYNRDHGNARSVRNLIQALLVARDTRLYKTPSDHQLSDEELTAIVEDDLKTVYQEASEKYRQELADKRGKTND